MLDVRLLQTFREVAMRGSFSLAAEELGFTQPAVSQHLARLEVTEDPMMIALPPDHPMASRRNIDLSELADEPFLLTELGGTCADSNIMLHACRDAGFAPTVRLESEDYNALQGMAAAGLGVSIVPRMATVGAHPRIVLRPLKGDAP